MNQRTQQPVTDPALAAAEHAETKRFGALKIPTSALRAYTMVLALIVVWLLFAWATGGVFLEARNFSNLMRQTAVTGVLAVGMLMVIVTGQIDLSVGSVAGLTGGIAAMLLTWLGWGIVPSLAVAVVVGAGIGMLQGTLTAYANVPAFIATLGGLLIWRGAIKGLSQGNTIPVELRSFKFIGQGYIAPIAGLAIAFVVVAAIVLINVRRIRARSAPWIVRSKHCKYRFPNCDPISGRCWIYPRFELICWCADSSDHPCCRRTRWSVFDAEHNLRSISLRNWEQPRRCETLGDQSPATHPACLLSYGGVIGGVGNHLYSARR